MRVRSREGVRSSTLLGAASVAIFDVPALTVRRMLSMQGRRLARQQQAYDDMLKHVQHASPPYMCTTPTMVCVQQTIPQPTPSRSRSCAGGWMHELCGSL